MITVILQAEAHHQEEWEMCSAASSNGEASSDPCRAVAAAASGNTLLNGSAQWQWVNYFLHTGHLSISGLKMSKSLKNFISIR